ncbi:MAG TPA: TonB-dependent receptor [Terriglobales bacterium]|nr:TonB-dependent receptor [Terriglobales bacterium]
MRSIHRCLFLFLFFASSSAAQSPTGTISGIVTDPTGATIAGAEVIVVNDATRVQFVTKSNAEGLYVVPNLLPGGYRIQVSKIGFKTIIKPDITLNVQDALAINFALPLGAVSEVVTIQGGAPLVNTENASVSTIIDRQFVENLPLNGQSFNTLLQLTPGVVISPSAPQSPGQFSISGQRTSSNDFTVDGVSANFGVSSSTVVGASGTGNAQAFSAIGGTSSLVSVDALQEFRVETSSFAPEFGHTPGGHVLLTTRSGTNDWHGGLFEYFRNDVLDANDWFANAAGKSRAPERHSDFGGTLGGPIHKNTTFFFLSYEGARLRLPQTLIETVPSEGARATGSTSVQSLLNAFPVPNGAVSADGNTAVFTGTASDSATLDAGSVRIDHHFNDRVSIFGRYNEAPSEFVTLGQGINDPQATEVNTRTATAGLNLTLGPGISNVLRFNYSSQSAGSRYSLTSGGGSVPYDPAILLGDLSNSSNHVIFGTFDSGFLLAGPLARNRNQQREVLDDLAFSKGSHLLKLGVDYRANYLDAIPYDHLFDYLSFSVSSLVTSSAADLLIPITTRPTKLLSRAVSLYAQDTWKINSRLTATYGLRWEVNPAPSSRNNTTIAAWTNVADPAAIALAPSGTSVWDTTYRNFAPRFGIAWTPTDKRDLVVRAGAGIFYDLGVGAAANLASGFPNNVQNILFGAPIPIGDPTPLLPVISEEPPFPGIVNAFSPSLSLPRSYQWNAAIEKSFSGSRALTFTYVGQAGRQLLRTEGLGAPNADFTGTFFLTTNGASSSYNALQVQFRQPMAHGVQALLNYTYSHSIDNASNDTVEYVSSAVISAANDRASSDFDVRHSFSGAVSIALPSPSKDKGYGMILRNWSTDIVVVARTGFPFNGKVSAPVQGSAPRADRIVGQPIWIASAAEPGGKSLNPAAFAKPAPGRQGTESRNDISGFGLAQVDLSLQRQFFLTDRLHLQFRTDAFNLFNHPNFTNPSALIGSDPRFFTSQSMLNQGLGGLNPLFQEGGPRSLQLSLKLTF